MREVLRTLDEAGSHWIVENVSNKRVHALVRAQHAFVISVLPDGRDLKLSSRDERHSLFGHLHEPKKIGLRRSTLHREMEMVRHEAVRDYCERILVRRTLNLQQRTGYERTIGKVVDSIKRAET